MALFLLLASLLAAVSCGGIAASGEAESVVSYDVSGDAERPSLAPTFDSPRALAEAILEGLASEDGATLETYALTKEQFRTYVWPELPASRPERGVPFDYGWGDLKQKSHNALLHTYERYKGRRMTLLEIEFEDGVTDYGSFKVHRDARVKIRRESDGRVLWLDLYGSVMERDGKYKLFSYVTD